MLTIFERQKHPSEAKSNIFMESLFRKPGKICEKKNSFKMRFSGQIWNEKGSIQITFFKKLTLCEIPIIRFSKGTRNH